MKKIQEKANGIKEQQEDQKNQAISQGSQGRKTAAR
jgi:hypothetical protein